MPAIDPVLSKTVQARVDRADVASPYLKAKLAPIRGENLLFAYRFGAASNLGQFREVRGSLVLTWRSGPTRGPPLLI